MGGKGPLGILRERAPRPGLTADATGLAFYYDDASANTVYLAGQFNDWANQPGDRKLAAMEKGAEGRWSITLPYREHVGDPRYDHLNDDVYVEHGRRYQYKLVVDRNRWITDPSNPVTIDDGFGNINSLLAVP